MIVNGPAAHLINMYEHDTIIILTQYHTLILLTKLPGICIRAGTIYDVLISIRNIEPIFQIDLDFGKLIYQPE